MPRPFPVHPVYTALTIAFMNNSLIADLVLPRLLVGRETFKYQIHNTEEGFTIPDTRVGRRSPPNEVQFGSTEAEGTCKDWGLEDPVPNDDIDNAPEGQDPLAQATEYTSGLIALDREKRTADLVFSTGQYHADNQTTLTGDDQWSEFDTSDPIADILAGLDACILRPNVMVIGQEAWSLLSRHPKTMKAVNGTAGDTGIARRKQIAELFELEDVLVGRGWLNTAKKGQPMTLQRVWGDSASLIYRGPMQNPMKGTSFGFTAQFGQRVAMVFEDEKIGLRGGQRVRVGESVLEVITSNRLGYLINDVAA